jgi:hypothetical protein
VDSAGAVQPPPDGDHPLPAELRFIIEVATRFIPGMALNVFAVGTGIGMAGLSPGLTFSAARTPRR